MDEREQEIRAAFRGLTQALRGFHEQLLAVERGLPRPAAEGEPDPAFGARAVLDCARIDHVEPLLRSLAEAAEGAYAEVTGEPDPGGEP
jgi:hypothetical protein